MSVEEARERVWQRFEQYAIWAPDERNEAIDRLILEVQADLPCYEWVRWGGATLQCGYPIPKEEPLVCPPCTARAKLREAIPA